MWRLANPSTHGLQKVISITWAKLILIPHVLSCVTQTFKLLLVFGLCTLRWNIYDADGLSYPCHMCVTSMSCPHHVCITRDVRSYPCSFPCDAHHMSNECLVHITSVILCVMLVYNPGRDFIFSTPHSLPYTCPQYLARPANLSHCCPHRRCITTFRSTGALRLTLRLGPSCTTSALCSPPHHR